MDEWHPERAVLESFLKDRLPEEGSWALQRHLVTCPLCEERMLKLLAREGSSPAGTDGGFQSLQPRALAKMDLTFDDRRAAIRQERDEAQELWRELRDQELGRECCRIASDCRYQSRSLCELLVEEARRTVLVEPRRAEDELRLALELAESLDPGQYGPGAVEAVQARAWAWLGNCLRVLADFRQAEQAFRMASLYFTQSWLDPLDEALILELKGSLRRGQRRFDDSVRLFDEAIALLRSIGELHLQGRVLVTKGLALQYKGDLYAAAECYRHSLDLLDGHEDPRAVVGCHFNLVSCLFDSGEVHEAAALIPEAWRRLEQDGSRHDRLRLHWLEGRVAAALGQTTEAEKIFLEVKETFVTDGIPFDVALASLDLAALYARTGRTAEVKRLAGEILPICRSCEVPQEALAALIVFQKAAEMEQLTLGVVEEVSTVLRRCGAGS